MINENGNELNLSGFDQDSSENIEENRRRFLSALGTDHKLSTVWQIHGDGVKIVRNFDEATNTDDKFDALISSLSGLLIGIKTADCVPILIGDPQTGSYAAIHAGWRGSVAAIATKAVRALKEAYNADPKNMIAAIGPSACGRKYEVGSDVIEAFAAKFSTSGKYFDPTREGHALVDLQTANHDQLVSEGIPEQNIYISPYCTIERTDLFFSYRAENRLYGKTGRSLSVVGLANA